MRPASEDELQATLIEAANLRGWLVAHFRPARTDRGWRTPVAGDVGFPDLLLARAGRVFAWELKGPRGTVSPWQRAWLDELAGGVTDARVVTPAELDLALVALELGAWPASTDGNGRPSG